MGDGTLFRGLDTGLTEVAELTKGFGELAEDVGRVANGVGTPPGTGATGAGRMAGVKASLSMTSDIVLPAFLNRVCASSCLKSRAS